MLPNNVSNNNISVKFFLLVLIFANFSTTFCGSKVSFMAYESLWEKNSRTRKPKTNNCLQTEITITPIVLVSVSCMKTREPGLCQRTRSSDEIANLSLPCELTSLKHEIIECLYNLKLWRRKNVNVVKTELFISAGHKKSKHLKTKTLTESRPSDAINTPKRSVNKYEKKRKTEPKRLKLSLRKESS